MKNDDAKLIRQILSGNQDAFTNLVKRYQKQIHAFAWRMMGDFHLAEEITQDTFLQAYKKLDTLREPNRFAAWLQAIVENCCYAYYRKTHPPITSIESIPEGEIERLYYRRYLDEQREVIATERRHKVVKHLLKKLPANEHTVITLHYLGEMCCEDISEFLEVPLNTIKSRLHRARKRLKKEEEMVRKTLGGFELPSNLTENIMQWIQMNEPGVAASVGTLAITSDRTLYAVMGYKDIYKLPSTENEWQLVNTDLLQQETHGEIPIAEHNGTLYIIPSNELFTSTDEGKTWNSVGPCPNGFVRELLIAENVFYLSLNQGVFQSVDGGSSWIDINNGLEEHLTGNSEIRLLRISQDTLFATSYSDIYRFIGETWEQLLLPIDVPIHVCSLEVSDNQIYVAVSVDIFGIHGIIEKNTEEYYDFTKDSWWILRSSDNGDSWEDITPSYTTNFMRSTPNIKLLAYGKTLLLVSGDEGVVVRSVDYGNTWSSVESSGITPKKFSVNSAVAIDENTFYTGGITGIHRSLDGGKTWHRFNSRIECRVDSLVSFKSNTDSQIPDSLYAIVAGSVVKSIDGGSSWTTVVIELDKYTIEIPQRFLLKYTDDTPQIVQISAVNGVLYAKGIRRNCETVYYRLIPEKDSLVPIEGMPTLSSSKLMWYVFGQVTFPFNSHRLSGQDILLTFSSAPESDHKPLTSKVIQENPEFGAECFLKQLEQIQGDHQLSYELILEGLYGNFAVSGETYYIEYNYKLFRWNPGDTEWFDTKIEETCQLSRANMVLGFKFATSGETIYVGKRDGHLLQSLDRGDSWNNITGNLPQSVLHYKQIVFTDSTVYVATDKGVFNSDDGIVWRTITDKEDTSLIIECLDATENTVYGANEKGIFYFQKEIGIWEQIVPEIPDTITCLVVKSDTFYVGSERSGVLRINRTES